MALLSNLDLTRDRTITRQINRTQTEVNSLPQLRELPKTSIERATRAAQPFFLLKEEYKPDYKNLTLDRMAFCRKYESYTADSHCECCGKLKLPIEMTSIYELCYACVRNFSTGPSDIWENYKMNARVKLNKRRGSATIRFNNEIREYLPLGTILGRTVNDIHDRTARQRREDGLTNYRSGALKVI